VERLTTIVFHPARADELASALRDDPRLADLDPAPVHDPVELRAALVEASLLVTTNGLPADAFERATRLRWIHVAAAGVDGVVNAALPTGVRVTRTMGSFGERMTEYVCAHLLALAQDVHGFRAQQHAGVWRNRPVGHLAGKTAGVLGVGSIGRVIARRLAQFGMTVHGLARSAGDEPSVARWFTPDHKLPFASELDVVVSTLPLTEATRGFVDRAFLGALPSSAWLVNVGRGAVVDEAALEAALFDGHLGAAVLDVFEREPLPSGSPLWRHPNAIVTPHQAGDAIASEVADAVAENLAKWRMGRPLAGEVDLERAY
jgi:glyoxylate/hydroxypyruvate reductase A